LPAFSIFRIKIIEIDAGRYGNYDLLMVNTKYYYKMETSRLERVKKMMKKRSSKVLFLYLKLYLRDI